MPKGHFDHVLPCRRRPGVVVHTRGPCAYVGSGREEFRPPASGPEERQDKLGMATSLGQPRPQFYIGSRRW